MRTPRMLAGLVGLVTLAFIGCAPIGRSIADRTFDPGVENMPGPGSVWLSSVPTAPDAPVPVTMTTPDDPSVLLAHTFPAGAALRGSFATSEGRYQLAAYGGACVIDITLGSSAVANVVLRVNESGCALEVVRMGSMDDPAMWNEEDGVLITNHNVGNGATRIEPPVEPVP